MVVDIIEEEENVPIDESEWSSTNQWKEKRVPGKRRNDLVSSLQLLGDYQGLLSPPQSVVSAANQAAAKAMLFVSGINVGSAYFECINMNDMPINCCKLLPVLIHCDGSFVLRDVMGFVFSNVILYFLNLLMCSVKLSLMYWVFGC